MRAGAPFSQSLSATGGIAPYSFALDSGSLPPGLTFAGNTISGTPTPRGSYSFAVKVTDNVGATQDKSYSGPISAPHLTLTPAALHGSVRTPFSVTYAHCTVADASRPPALDFGPPLTPRPPPPLSPP